MDRWGIEQWINVDAIQLLVHHASAVAAAIVVFALVARLAIWLLPHGLVREIVVIIDDIVLIGLVAYFGWEMFRYLWSRRGGAARSNAAISPRVVAVKAYLPPSLAKPLDALARALGRFGAAQW